MRVVLITGKGGVGTSTVAAATALHAARCGVKTALVCHEEFAGLAGSSPQQSVLAAPFQALVVPIGATSNATVVSGTSPPPVTSST